MALLLAPGVPEGGETLFGSLGKALRPAEGKPPPSTAEEEFSGADWLSLRTPQKEEPIWT